MVSLRVYLIETNSVFGGLGVYLMDPSKPKKNGKDGEVT